LARIAAVSICGEKPLTFIIPLLSVLALAACAAPPSAKAPGSAPSDSASYTQPLDTISPPPGAAHAKPAAPSLTDLARGPQRFEGLEGKTVLAALGDPNFRRRDKPAEVWQYYGPGCILDLFLYDDAPGISPTAAGKPVEGMEADGTVAHAELRGREGRPAEVACLSRLITQRHAPVS
jgi:hypothetical protein